MKHKVVFLILFMCFVCYLGFSFGGSDRNQNKGTQSGGSTDAVVNNNGEIITELAEIRYDLAQLRRELSVQGRNQSTEPQTRATLETVPVTPAILNIIGQIPGITSFDQIKNQLSFFISENFDLRVYEQSSAPQYRIENRALVFPANSSSEPIIISYRVDEPGALIDREGDFLLVEFQGKPNLRFRKNNQNFYELFSIQTSAGAYSNIAVEGDRPLLKILVQGSPVTIVESRQPFAGQQSNERANVNGGNNNEQQSPVVPPTRPDTNGGNNSEQQSPTVSRTHSNILATENINKNAVIAYIRSQNHSLQISDVEPLIDTYISEASEEGVNQYFAIAQMLRATDFFRNRERMRVHNYAGLSNAVELPGRNIVVEFPNMTIGVRAHIQHLKGYASETPPNRDIVDPRYEVLIEKNYLGRAVTFEQVYTYWAEDSVTYRNNIERILQGMGQY
ncbi:MAG: hypothetical protein LBI28_00780 [Treponema sp.]|jgi:hypothetical protein|nr:hypothetical protein [Treponema sp.]